MAVKVVPTGRIFACYDIKERRFSSAIGTDDSMSFALLQFEVNSKKDF
jgi:hypothetical protein